MVAVATPGGPHAEPTGRPHAPVRVVYILGTGRCGSTLLDIILGSHPDICSTGELRQLSATPRGEDQPCSCGADVHDCALWGPVIARVEREFPLDELERDRGYELTRSLPRTALLLGLPRSGASRYAARLATLLRTIAQESGRPVVVDSSKHMGRGLILWKSRRHGLDVRYIHMVRDGRGFVWSKLKVLDGQGLGLTPPDRNVVDLSAWWVLSNMLSALLFRLHPGRYRRVRYEDLVARPERTLTEIGRFIGVDLSGVIEAIRTGQPLPVEHVVGGNRLRFSRALVLKPDTDWQRNLPLSDERTFWGIAGWLARRYGYESHRPVAPTREPALGSHAP